MRISDWSSDVCSSDLQAFPPPDSFARGDSRQFGAIITGTAASQDSVTADTVAGAQLLTSGETGLGTSNVGTDTVVSFSLIDPRQVTFTFAARGTLDVRLDPRSEEQTSELQSLMRISYAV